MFARFICFALLFVGSLFLSASVSPCDSAERPNIILVMVDDMGFSDLGCYGGEIQTPHLDRLAVGGVRFDQFYNSGRCCPTRATLLTGLHPHQTGIGHMTLTPTGKPKPNVPATYQGFLNRNCVTIAEVLGRHGYKTLMTGKWHLGMHESSVYPLARGFDRFYGSLAGATRFFFPEHPRGMTGDNAPVDMPKSTTDDAFYTTDAFTDHAIRFIKDHQSANAASPFFLYLAYTAPHWPLQAFEEDIAKYRGKYRAGWQKLRESRYQKQIELGLIRPSWKLSPPSESIPEWDSLSTDKQDEMDLKMAVYAAMIDRVDQNIGKLVGQLTEQRLLDSTLILFLSDNGACQEGGMLGRGEFKDVEQRNREAANSYGEAWANVSSTPFRLYKHFAHEGGAATPFFMHWPARIKPRSQWYREPAQLIDILPTLMDVAGADYPKQFDGNQITPLDGISLRPAFDGQTLDRESPIFIEHEKNAFVRDGRWKLVGRAVATTRGTDPTKWELYDMHSDRTETNDVVQSNATLAFRLAGQWEAWAERVGVYPKPTKRKRK